MKPLLKPLCRYPDLKAAKIVSSRKQLGVMIERDGFPPGFLLSPMVRAWDVEEVEAYVAKRKQQVGKGNCGFLAKRETESADA